MAMSEKKDDLTKEVFLGGILVLLAVIAALLFQDGWKQMQEKDNPLSIPNLKKAEQETLDRYKQSGTEWQEKRNASRLESYEQNIEGSLARADVSEFFDQNVPFDQPNLPMTYLLAWYSFAVTDIMTFGFNDYKTRLSMSSDYFTERGWKSFSKGLERSRIIEMVEVNKQYITAAPKGAPIIQSRRALDGRYQWVVEIPMVLTYMSGAKRSNSGLLVTAIIVRSDDPKHPYGIGIEQWIAMAR